MLLREARAAHVAVGIRHLATCLCHTAASDIKLQLTLLQLRKLLGLEVASHFFVTFLELHFVNSKL